MKDFEKKIGTAFKTKKLLKEAITHRSYLNENPKWGTPHNERLEYLGDAVLELVVTDFLFQKFEDKQEGELTAIRAALVNHIMLGRVSEELELENILLLSKGESKENGRAKEAILANTVEAIIGAIYLDKGYKAAAKFIDKFILQHTEEILEKELFIDAKSHLQEIAQEKHRITPTYRTLKEIGPDHEKEFIAGVYLGKKKITEGKGFSKQEAERSAAENALAEWKE